MTQYKEIPEWKKKILAKKGKNKRDRTKNLRNQHKKPQIPIIKIPVAKIIKNIENINKEPKKEKLMVNKNIETKVGKLVSHYELLIKSREKK